MLLPRRIACVLFGTELARDDVDNVGCCITSLSKILFVAVASHTSEHRHGLDVSNDVDSAGSVHDCLEVVLVTIVILDLHNFNLRTICDLSLSIVGFALCSAGVLLGAPVHWSPREETMARKLYVVLALMWALLKRQEYIVVSLGDIPTSRSCIMSKLP